MFWISAPNFHSAVLIFFWTSFSFSNFLTTTGRKLLKSATKKFSGHFEEKPLLRVQKWVWRVRNAEKLPSCAKLCWREIFNPHHWILRIFLPHICHFEWDKKIVIWETSSQTSWTPGKLIGRRSLVRSPSVANSFALNQTLQYFTKHSKKFINDSFWSICALFSWFMIFTFSTGLVGWIAV